MQTKTKAIIVGVVFAIIGFMLNPFSPLGEALWGEVVLSGDGPSGAETLGLMLYSVIESAAFGVGVAFIVFGWGLMKRAASSIATARAAFVAIAWLLVSWVPHSAMHMTNAHDNYARLVAIEYMFHVTIILSAITLLVFFLGVVRNAKATTATSAAPVAGATPRA